MTEAQRIARFKEMAERHNAKHAGTKEAARAYLVGLGIYTDDGELAPEYGGPPRKSKKKVRKG